MESRIKRLQIDKFRYKSFRHAKQFDRIRSRKGHLSRRPDSDRAGPDHRQFFQALTAVSHSPDRDRHS